MLLFNVLLIATAVIIVVKVLSILFEYRKNRQLLRKIPSPPESLYIFVKNPDLLFSKIRAFSKEYYPIYRLSAAYINVVSFLDPDDIELILSSTKHLSKSRIYSFLRNWLGTGLLTSTGEKWHKRRKILTPAFHFTILQEFLHVFNEETNKLVDRLAQKHGIIDVVPPITNFTLQSISETAMGFADMDETSQQNYKRAVYDIGRIFLRRLSQPWLLFNPIYSLTKLAKQERSLITILHDFSNRMIEKREASTNIMKSIKKKRLAMLDLLLDAKHSGVAIDNAGIREEVDTFMFEGHDTTSMAISFMLLVLANLEDVQAKIFEEILSIVGPQQPPTYTHLRELRYTERCIKETLRLFPSVPFISRHASQNFTTTTGYFIPRGTILHLHIFDVHRNEKIYPDPLKFDPDRFLPENVNKRHPFAYIPFSAGPRNCIGQKFAILELKTVLCGILRKFKLEKVDDMYGIEFRPDLVLRPKKEINVRIVPRW